MNDGKLAPYLGLPLVSGTSGNRGKVGRNLETVGWGVVGTGDAQKNISL